MSEAVHTRQNAPVTLLIPYHTAPPSFIPLAFRNEPLGQGRFGRQVERAGWQIEAATRDDGALCMHAAGGGVCVSFDALPVWCSFSFHPHPTYLLPITTTIHDRRPSSSSSPSNSATPARSLDRPLRSPGDLLNDLYRLGDDNTFSLLRLTLQGATSTAQRLPSTSYDGAQPLSSPTCNFHCATNTSQIITLSS